MVNNMPFYSAKHQGFSLLEMLIAIGIYSLISAIAYGGLAHIIKQQNHLQQKQSRNLELHTAVGLMNRELHQALPRASWHQSIGVEPAMVATNNPVSIVFWRQADVIDGSIVSLQKLGYQLNNGTLWRLHWPLKQHDLPPQRYALMEGVSALQWRFLDSNGTWYGQWPPSGASATIMPQAIDLHLQSEGNPLFTSIILGYGIQTQ